VTYVYALIGEMMRGMLLVFGLLVPAFGCSDDEGAAGDLDFTVIVHSLNERGVRLPGAAAELRTRANDAVLASGTTDARGEVTLAFASGGAPVDAYAVVRYSGGAMAYSPTHFESQCGIASGTALDLYLWPMAFNHQAAVEAGTTWNEVQQITDVAFVDCHATDQILAGAVITVTPGGGTHYQSAIAFDSTLTETTVGNATDFNVPAGPVSFAVTYHGATTMYAAKATGGIYHMHVLHP
jgi:hypothetical protein